MTSRHEGRDRLRLLFCVHEDLPKDAYVSTAPPTTSYLFLGKVQPWLGVLKFKFTHEPMTSPAILEEE